MKKRISILTLVVMLLVCLIPLNVSAKSGKWKQNKKGWWYEYSDGSYAKETFVTINNKTYYFNKNGYMVTGWKQIKNKWYYFGSNGAMKTGWVKSGNKWYYMNAKNGQMTVGWLYWKNKYYYLNSSGTMRTGWLYLKNKYYYFNSDGQMMTGWISWKGNNYYTNSNGELITNKTFTVGGKSYTADSSGKVLITDTKPIKLDSRYKLTDTDIKTMKDIINKVITPNMTQEEQIRAIHDWIVKNTKYDTNYKQHNAHETLNDHLAVCSGYSDLFNAFMDLLGIPCKVIEGTSTNNSGQTGDHAWNAVKLNDGYWYYVDVTYDDPLYNGRSDYTDGYNLRYDYFLISKSTINKNHKTSTSLSPEAKTDYDRSIYNNLALEKYKTQYAKNGYNASVIHSYDDFNALLKKATVNTKYAVIIDNTEIKAEILKEKINSYRLVLSSGSSITHTTTGTNIEIISFYYK